MKDPLEMELLERALDIKVPAARRRFLNEARAGNPDMRARVEDLLARSERIDAFFPGAAAELNELAGREEKRGIHGRRRTGNHEPGRKLAGRDARGPRGGERN
jgi:hypothetical protein